MRRLFLPGRTRSMQDAGVTRTWLQKILQQSDTDLLSYDFGESCAAWEAWWFRICCAAGVTVLAVYLWQAFAG